MVIRECFNIFGGNSGLTEEIIYWNPPKGSKRDITVYSGATLGNTLLGVVDRDTMISGKPIKIFEAPAIVIVRKGLAGKTKFIERGSFTINDDAYVITVKEKHADKIDIEWVEKVIQNYANSCITSRGTNGTFSKEQFLDLDFDYPSLQEQKEVVHVYKAIDFLKKRVHILSEHMENLEKYMVCGDTIFQKEVEKIFDIKGGNSCLTEEFIYNNQPISENEAVVVFSSSTDVATNMGVVSKNAQTKGGRIKCFKGPAVIIARNGQAGKVMFIPRGIFTINDHAYVLTVKPAYTKAIDLEWFAIMAEKYTKKCVTSKDSNGTFSKEMFLKEQVDIIDCVEQKKIVRQKRKISILNSKLKKFTKMLDGKEENFYLETMMSRG